MSNIPLPIVEIELKHIRHHLSYVLGQHSQAYKEALDRAIAEFCTPENFYREVKLTVDVELNRAVRDKVTEYLRGAVAREVVEQAATEALINVLKSIKLPGSTHGNE